MRNLILFTILIQATFVFGQYNLNNLSVDLSEEAISSFTYKKLGIFPVRANDVFRLAHKEIGKYTVLSDAIADKKIEISEVSSSGTVNTLHAKNTSRDSIYIMAGEILQGGKQDRIISQDIILAPGESRNIDVFCVEQGRWRFDDDENAGFNNHKAISGTSIRRAAEVKPTQQKVWESISSDITVMEAPSETMAYTDLIATEIVSEELDDYLNHFRNFFINDEQVIGIVAVSGDKVIACDLFATHSLFISNYHNLVQSYAIDAIISGENVEITKKDIISYLENFLADETKQEENLRESGNIFKHNGNRIRISSY